MTPDTTLLQGLSSQLAAVVAQVAPSVVRVDDGTRLTATGVLWSADGLVLTTSHGVERDDDVHIVLHNGTRLPASIVGRDDESDLALLRVQAQGLPAVTPAESDAAQVGHLVLALGRPGGSGLQATMGIISARLEAQSDGQDEHILNTDATLYPGFSGGPLVSMSGQVVGLTNLALGRGQGVALGVPILTHVVQSLLAGGPAARGYLGVSTQRVSLNDAQRTALGLTQTRALLIVQVADGSPAEQGGLLLGDVLLAIEGHAVEDADDLRRRLRHLAAGQGVTLRLIRAGAVQDLPVTLGAADDK